MPCPRRPTGTLAVADIGGRSGFTRRGNGTATVTGAGSEIIVQGYDALINVGREAGGNGTLNVLAGGKVSSISMAVGISGTGTVNIDNATDRAQRRTAATVSVGAGTTIGRGTGGNGTLDHEQRCAVDDHPHGLERRHGGRRRPLPCRRHRHGDHERRFVHRHRRSVERQ